MSTKEINELRERMERMKKEYEAVRASLTVECNAPKVKRGFTYQPWVMGRKS